MISDSLRALAEVAAILDRQAVPFAVGGSIASGAWGEPRSTHDVDVLIRLEPGQIGPLVLELSKTFYVDEDSVRDAVRRCHAFNIIHLTYFQKVDVFVAGPGALDAAQLERAIPRELGPDPELRFPVTAPEVIVLRKLSWFDKGDRVSERQWRDVLAVLRVQRQRLDRGFMLSLARDSGLEPLLRLACDEAWGRDDLPSTRA